MILIIQNGTFATHITKYLDKEYGEYEIIKSFEHDVSTISLDKYSIIIILGGNQSVTKICRYPYLLKTVKLINKCLKINKPLVGICLGCQLIAYALGCEIKSSKTLNIGYDASLLGYSNVFRCHFDYVVPNKSIQVLEYMNEMPYLYKYDDNTYGIQCHPDITPECVENFSNNETCNRYARENKEKIDKTNQLIITEILKMAIDSKPIGSTK